MLANFALTERTASILMVQVGALPAAAHAPPHALNTAFPLGVAVNWTLVPGAYDSLQSEPQFMPGPVTVPGPDFETVRMNTGAVIVKLTAPDTLPSGLATVTCAVPGAAISAEAIVAVSRVAETNVVVRAAPFQRTEEPLT